MNITNRNRKKLWLVGAILVLLYFAPSALQSFRQAALLRERQRAAEAAAQAWRNAPAAVPADAPSAAVIAEIGSLIGVWGGQQAQTNHEICQLALEVRNQAAVQVTGYAKLVCYPLPSYYPGQPKVDPGTAFLKAFTPIEAVLTAALSGTGAIPFHIDKAIGASVDGCALTSFTVTPFGNDQLAAEWQKGTCPGGQMTLQRIRK